MKIALAQFNPTVGDFEGNSRAHSGACRERRKSGGAELAVFSELCLCGYPPQDLIERPVFIERNQTELDSPCRKTFRFRPSSDSSARRRMTPASPWRIPPH